MSEQDKVAQILETHRDKNFVKRVLDWDGGEEQPYLTAGGKKQTHLMGTGEADGVHYSFPTIAMVDGELKKMDPQQAFQHAMDTGEAIPFDTAEEAYWFSTNYKNNWESEDAEQRFEEYPNMRESPKGPAPIPGVEIGSHNLDKLHKKKDK